MTGEWVFWFCVTGQGGDKALFLIVTLGHVFWFKMAFFFFFLLGNNIKRRKKRKQAKTKRYHYPSWALSLFLDYKVFSLHCFCLIVGPGRHFHFTWPFFFPSHTHTQCLHCHHICQRLFWCGFIGNGFNVMAYLGLVEFFFIQSSSGAMSVEQSDLTQPRYIIRLFRDAKWKAFAVRF